jgi:protein involved in polysaccharide export with SLBB domain
MPRNLRSLGILALVLLGATGCTSITDTLGLNRPSYPMLKDARDIRNASPVPPGLPNEMAKVLLPPYVVEPGDNLVVQPAEPDSKLHLSFDATVQPDGAINLGKYGQPVVAGMTIPQIAEHLKQVIKAQEKNAKDEAVAVTVRLSGRTGRVYYVVGEVKIAGAFQITGRETVLDGIIAAGGITGRASIDNVILSRPTSPDGCRLVYPVCLRQIMELGDPTTNYQLQPGDRIFVPTKGRFENMIPAKWRHTPAICNRPQVACFATWCTPGGGTHLSREMPAELPPVTAGGGLP